MTTPTVRSSRAGGPVFLLLDTPLAWAVATFAVYFFYAQFVPAIKWNAIELIIAQHLIEHHVFATSVDYPSAITWRPVMPTLVVTFFRLWTDDPILIYRCVCGVSLSALVASLFAAARILWSRIAAHVTALLAFTCPGLTVYLVNHQHSYSHIGGLLFLGPALLLSLFLLKEADAPAPPSIGWYALTGLAWGFGYLSRTELLLFCAIHGAMLGWIHWRRRWPWRPLFVYAGLFAICFIPYNLHAGNVSRRDGLLARKSIYTFYASQGWSDPPPDVGGDVEGDGYRYAIKLYGEAVANDESLLTAIRKNPSAFFRRVVLNARVFYAEYANRDFFPLPWTAAGILALGLILFTRNRPQDRWAVGFLTALFLASHFILIYHIDARYLSVNLPLLLLLAGFTVHRLIQLFSCWPMVGKIAATLLLLAAAYSSRNQVQQLIHHGEPNHQSVEAMKSIGEHFRATVPHPQLTTNREPHITLAFPASPVLPAEDQFLVPYFTRSAWVNGGAEGAFPRGRIYSYRDCPTDYEYVPFNQVNEPGRRGHMIAEYTNPILGHYALMQLNP